MVCCIGQEVNLGLVEEGRPSTVSLRKNYFIEQLDTGVLGMFGLTLIDEFVESCCPLVNCRSGTGTTHLASAAVQ